MPTGRIVGIPGEHGFASVSEDFSSRQIGGCYKGGNGKDLPCYILPRRECDLVVSGYSVKYRLAIIDRWQELEASSSIIASARERALSYVSPMNPLANPHFPFLRGKSDP